MDWTGIYDGTIRHMAPRSEPYAGILRSAVLECRSPIAAWIVEAEAMLKGFGQSRGRDDLAMLAAMVERGGLAMLPARALAHHVARAIRADRHDLSVRTMGYDRLMAVMPLDEEGATRLVRDIVEQIVRNVVQAVDRLGMAARNAGSPPGNRADLTSSARRDRLEPVWIMATTVIEPLVPVTDLAREMTGRLAA